MPAAVLALAAILAGTALADCGATREASAQILDRQRQRQEERSSLPSREAVRQAWRGCLAGLEAWGIPAGPELFPVPALAEVTEGLCREARGLALDQIPGPLPPLGQAGAERRREARPDFGQEVREALR
jgi:hypothetical protein